MQPQAAEDFVFKILLVGDSGTGKTCLLTRFTKDVFEDKLLSTIGVDFAIKRLNVYDKHIKLTIWDTAGQEKFRTLTNTFYRGAKGVIFVYDVTSKETLQNLEEIWLQEVELYGTEPDIVKMLVANKVDLNSIREVSWQEGSDFARKHGCLFVETSAKANVAVATAFEELVLKILETPSLTADAAGSRSLNVSQEPSVHQRNYYCC